MRQNERQPPFGMDGTFTRRELLSGSAALGASILMPGAVLAQETPKRGGDLKMAISQGNSSDSMDPASHTADYMYSVATQVYDSLTRVDEKVKVQPGLAESWEGKAGATEWTFKLRNGVTFHNGKSLDAEDVVYSLNHHRGKDSKSALRGMMSAISDIKAVGKNEILITMERGNADLPALLSDWHLGVIPRDSAFDAGVGTGGYALDSFQPGVRTRTKRNANDWLSKRGFVDTIETLSINDSTARLSALMSGAVHLINKVDPKSVSLLQQSPQVRVHNTPGGSHNVFAMLCDTAPYDNLDLRLALKYAIDREGLLKNVLRGHGVVGNDQPIPSFDPFYAEMPQRKFDPEKAKFHYKRSNHSGPLSLTVADVAFSGAVDAGQFFQSSAAQCGIDVQISRAPNDGYYSSLWMKRPFMATYWGGRPTADFIFSLAYASNAPSNETHWRNPKFDELLTSARVELDITKRKQMYADMQRMVHEDGGSIIPVFNNFIDATQSNIRGFVPSPVQQLGGYRAFEGLWFA
jgi:peptide/nickel transport system substrate-binding protein